MRNFCFLIVLLFLASCKGVQEGPFFSATGQAQIKPGASFTEGKLLALRLAEKVARDQILFQAKDHLFSNGVTVEEAMIADPFVRAKIYDTIRTAKITDQTINKEGSVTVTVRFDMAPLMAILADANYAQRIAKVIPRDANHPIKQPAPPSPSQPAK